MLNDSLEIRQKMEGWARWRLSYIGGYGKTFLEKCLEGMPGTNCYLCHGVGHIRDHPECPTCHGSGRVKLTSNTRVINPAFIHATYLPIENPLCEAIDKAVCHLRKDRRRHYSVVWEEYCNPQGGTRNIRSSRLRISYGHYRDLLYEAHQWLSDWLKCSVDNPTNQYQTRYN
jgi:hypothetical protein